MKIKNINERWKDFEKAVLNGDFSANQRKEMKRAFFAGFADALNAFDQIARLKADEFLTQHGKLEKEILGFAEAIQLGAA